MPSIRKRTTKKGAVFYEIRVSRGRGKSYLTRRWYPPEGWSQKAIDRELSKVAAEFEREAQAGEIISRAEKRENDDIKAAQAAKILTVRQYIERVYMPTVTVTASETTRTSYQGNLNKWVIPALGDMKINDVSSAQITALLMDMQKKKKSHSTVIKVYTILNSLFKMLYLSDMIDRNPMDKVQRPKPRKDEVKPAQTESFTLQELKEILTLMECEPLKWRCFVRLLVDTGARRGEICALQWPDINMKTGEILIHQNLCYTPEKGVYLDKPKNGKSRVAYIGEETISLLRLLRAEQSEKAVSLYVFTQEGSPEPMHPTSPTHYFRQFARKNNIKGFHPHKLRHSFASLAIISGADVASVSEVLGHSDKAVTLRMYTHSDEESRRRASQIVQKAIKKSRAGIILSGKK